MLIAGLWVAGRGRKTIVSIAHCARCRRGWNVFGQERASQKGRFGSRSGLGIENAQDGCRRCGTYSGQSRVQQLVLQYSASENACFQLCGILSCPSVPYMERVSKKYKRETEIERKEMYVCEYITLWLALLPSPTPRLGPPKMSDL